MIDEERRRMQERLPDWVAGRLDGEVAAEVARAVEADAELADEAELLGRLHARIPRPPEGLADRISAALLAEGEEAERVGRSVASLQGRSDPVRTPGAVTVARGVGERGPGRVSWWLLAAAATVVLVIGSVEIIERSGEAASGGALETVALDRTASSLVAEEEFVAGAPVLDALSDEALRALLAELEG